MQVEENLFKLSKINNELLFPGCSISSFNLLENDKIYLTSYLDLGYVKLTAKGSANGFSSNLDIIISQTFDRTVYHTQLVKRLSIQL